MKKLLQFALLLIAIHLSATAQDSIYEPGQEEREGLLDQLQTANLQQQAELYNKIAETYVYVDTSKTLDYARLALETAKDSGDVDEMVRAHRNLGTAYHITGNFDRALENLYEADQKEGCKDIQLKSNVKLALSLVYAFAELWEPAEKLLKEAHDGFFEVGAEFDMARVNLNQAKNALTRKELKTCLEAYEEAKSHARLSGSDKLDGHFRMIEGLLYIEQERYDDAISSLEQALDFFETRNFTSSLCAALSKLALCYQQIGDYEKSDQCANRCVIRDHDIIAPRPVSDSYQVLSENAAIRGEFELAYKMGKHAQSIGETMRKIDLSNQLAIVESLKNISLENESRTALIATNKAQGRAIILGVLLIIGTIILVMLLFRHIRSLQELQKQEHEFSEQLKAKQDAIVSRNKDLAEIISHRDRLYSIIAHDLKSPIAALHGLMQTLTSEDLQQTETHEILKSLVPSVRSTYELVERLIEWAQTQQMELNPKPEVINLFNIYESAIEYIKPFLERKNITLIPRIAVNHEVYFDRGMLVSILRSLLSNSAKFTNPDGKIDIQSLPDLSGIVFKNSGVRIPQAVIDAINTNQTVESSFGTSGEKGTGLGLTIIKTLLEANGGSIEFHADTSGTTATVYFPRAPKS